MDSILFLVFTHHLLQKFRVEYADWIDSCHIRKYFPQHAVDHFSFATSAIWCLLFSLLHNNYLTSSIPSQLETLSLQNLYLPSSSSLSLSLSLPLFLSLSLPLFLSHPLSLPPPLNFTFTPIFSSYFFPFSPSYILSHSHLLFQNASIQLADGWHSRVGMWRPLVRFDEQCVRMSQPQLLHWTLWSMPPPPPSPLFPPSVGDVAVWIRDWCVCRWRSDDLMLPFPLRITP